MAQSQAQKGIKKRLIFPHFFSTTLPVSHHSVPVHHFSKRIHSGLNYTTSSIWLSNTMQLFLTPFSHLDTILMRKTPPTILNVNKNTVSMRLKRACQVIYFSYPSEAPQCGCMMLVMNLLFTTLKMVHTHQYTLLLPYIQAAMGLMATKHQLALDQLTHTNQSLVHQLHVLHKFRKNGNKL